MRRSLVGLSWVVCLLGLALAPQAEGQLRDLLSKLVGDDEGGSIDEIEAISNDGTTLLLRVRFSAVEDPGEVVLTARMLDFRLRTLRGFEVEPVSLSASEGEAELTVTFAGDDSVNSASVEVRLEKDGDRVAKRLHPLVYVWQSSGSGLDTVVDALMGGENAEQTEPAEDGVGGSTSTPTGTSADAPPAIVIDPVRLGDTPEATVAEIGGASSGGAGIGGSTGTSPSPSQAGTHVLIGTLRPQILLASFWNLGYLWANQQSSTSYTPSATYAYNTSGGGMKVSRSSVGSYALQFDQLGAGSKKGGNLQVTAYGGDSARCQAVGWNVGPTGFRGSVKCTNAAGAAVDSRFTSLAALSLGSNRTGYIYVGRTATMSHPIDGRYVSNSGGSAVSVTRQSPGVFVVRFPGLAAGGSNQGNVQVTSYGTAGEYCKLSGATATGGEIKAGVRCYSATGQLRDSRFSVLAVVAAAGAKGIAYTRGNGNSPSATPTPGVTFGPGTPQVSRSRSGVYSVSFPGLGSSRGGTVQVTAMGSNANWCKVAGWGAAAASFSASIKCFGSGGQSADSPFSILVVR